MTVITLTFLPSIEQVVSGVPRFVEIEANIPATIYYTTDGTLPSLLSPVYTSAVKMPTQSSAILSAVAYYLDNSHALVPSAILTETYMTDQSELTRSRYIFFEGLVYSYPGGINIPIYFDYLGNEVYSIDVPLADLFPLVDEQDRLGNTIHPDNEVLQASPDETATMADNEEINFSTPNGSETFNPEAKFILIDGRPGAAPPVVDLLNGGFMSLKSPRTNFGGTDYHRINGQNQITGSALKYHFDRSRNIIAFYYMDNRSNRWVKSIQTLANEPYTGAYSLHSTPLVFKWRDWGTTSII